MIDMVSSITILVQTLKNSEMQNQEEATVKVARSYSPTETFPTCAALCMSRMNSWSTCEHISQKVEDYDLIGPPEYTGITRLKEPHQQKIYPKTEGESLVSIRTWYRGLMLLH